MQELKYILSKYFYKKGNRYIFINGLTLNSLSSEMWMVGIDSSVLSRVLNGERIFNSTQLKKFCEILHLDDRQKDELSNALQVDYLARRGFLAVKESFSSIDIIDLIALDVKCIHDAREHGLTNYVMKTSNALILKIESIIGKVNKVIYKNELYKLLGMLYSEKIYASGCSLTPEENMEVIFPLVEKQIELARLSNVKNLLIEAKIHLAFAFYAQGNYEKDKKTTYFYATSLYFIQEAIDLKPTTTHLKLLCWRLVALNSTYLKKQELFYLAQKNIDSIITNNEDDSGFSFIPWALDSISRGQSYFGDGKAMKTLERSKEFSKKMKWSDPLRETAMIRNEIEVLQNFKIIETDYILNQAKRGFELSNNFGFSRYYTYFEKFLKRH